MGNIRLKKCRPYDSSCHLEAIKSWHDEFESSIESLISYLQTLSKSSKQARVECSKHYSKIFELTQAKTRFTFEVSHELKSPLAAVYNILNAIIGGYLRDDTGKQLELLTRARFRVKEVITLLNDLLILSRLEEGTGRLRKELISIDEILLSVCKEMEGYAGEKGIQFTYRLADDLPPIFGNPELIRRVFANIVDNAIKYTDPGGSVKVMAIGEGNFLLFQVRDTGIGIRKDELPKVFDVFFRGSEAKPKGKREGMGLGLSLVKRIIDDHKGAISIKSKFGRGTTVVLQFPEGQKGETNGKTNTYS